MTVMSYVPFSVERISVVLILGVQDPLDALLFMLEYLLTDSMASTEKKVVNDRESIPVSKGSKFELITDLYDTLRRMGP